MEGPSSLAVRREGKTVGSTGAGGESSTVPLTSVRELVHNRAPNRKHKKQKKQNSRTQLLDSANQRGGL